MPHFTIFSIDLKVASVGSTQRALPPLRQEEVARH